MFNILFEHIQDTCLPHYNIIQRDSEESQLTYEVCLPTGQCLTRDNKFLSAFNETGAKSYDNLQTLRTLGKKSMNLN